MNAGFGIEAHSELACRDPSHAPLETQITI
jgi:hypothetical protein